MYALCDEQVFTHAVTLYVALDLTRCNAKQLINYFLIFFSVSIHLILNFVLGGVALFMAIVIIILVCGIT